MAQNFRRYTSNDVGTGAATLFTANSYDTVVGISVANVTSSSVNASVTLMMHLMIFILSKMHLFLLVQLCKY